MSLHKVIEVTLSKDNLICTMWDSFDEKRFAQFSVQELHQFIKDLTVIWGEMEPKINKESNHA